MSGTESVEALLQAQAGQLEGDIDLYGEADLAEMNENDILGEPADTSADGAAAAGCGVTAENNRTLTTATHDDEEDEETLLKTEPSVTAEDQHKCSGGGADDLLDAVLTERTDEGGATNGRDGAEASYSPASSYQGSVGGGGSSGQVIRKYLCYVGNMTWWTTDRELGEVVSSVGIRDIIDIKFYENRQNGQSKGFALVVMGSEASQRVCLERVPGKQIHGQQLVVVPYSRQALERFQQATKKPSEQQKEMKKSSAEQIARNDGSVYIGKVHLGAPRLGAMPPQGPPLGGGPPPGLNLMSGPPPPQLAPQMAFGPPGGGQPPTPGQLAGMVVPMGGLIGQPIIRGPPPPPNSTPVSLMAAPPPLFHHQHHHQQPQPNRISASSAPPPPGVPPPLVNRPPPAFPHMAGGPPQQQHQQRFGPHGVGGGGPAPPFMTSGAHINPNVYPGVYPQGGGGGGGGGGPPYGSHAEAALSEAEFEEIMNRNRTVSSSAISRAVSDAAAGDYASAIETLVTAISLIRQSRVAHDDRCRVLITSLQDTLSGIEAKSYARRSKESRRSRSPTEQRSSRKRHRRSRTRSRSRDRYDYSPRHGSGGGSGSGRRGGAY